MRCHSTTATSGVQPGTVPPAITLFISSKESATVENQHSIRKTNRALGKQSLSFQPTCNPSKKYALLKSHAHAPECNSLIEYAFPWPGKTLLKQAEDRWHVTDTNVWPIFLFNSTLVLCRLADKRKYQLRLNYLKQLQHPAWRLNTCRWGILNECLPQTTTASCLKT